MNDKQQQSRINDVLYQIHRDISAPLFAKDLAEIAAYSEQHFHRVFKQTVGETFNHYIRRTRLEHAANQLMFDHHSSVLSIAEKCGFISLSSFTKAFKTQFKMTPGQWRDGGYPQKDRLFLSDPEIKAGYQRIQKKPLPLPNITVLSKQHVAYIRHQGYGRSIHQTWELLKAWAIEEGIFEQAHQIGLHHSNPA